MSVIQKIINKNELTTTEIIQYLRDINVLKRNLVCSNCKVFMVEIVNNQKKDKVMWRCNGCKVTKDIRHESTFEYSKVSLLGLINLTILFSKDTLIKDVEETGISKPTVIKWFSRLKCGCRKYLESKETRLGGQGSVVQIDESQISKRKYNVGRIKKERWLFGAIDNINKNFIIKNIEARTKVQLQNIIYETIKEGKEIHSDEWLAYMSLFKNNNDYTHKTVNHSKNFVNPETGVHTNLIENLWMRLKQSLRRKYQRSTLKLDSYIDEFSFKTAQKDEPIDRVVEILLKFI